MESARIHECVIITYSLTGKTQSYGLAEIDVAARNED